MFLSGIQFDEVTHQDLATPCDLEENGEVIGAGHYVLVRELDHFVLSRLQFTLLWLNHKQFVVLHFHLEGETVWC